MPGGSLLLRYSFSSSSRPSCRVMGKDCTCTQACQLTLHTVCFTNISECLRERPDRAQMGYNNRGSRFSAANGAILSKSRAPGNGEVRSSLDVFVCGQDTQYQRPRGSRKKFFSLASTHHFFTSFTTADSHLLSVRLSSICRCYKPSGTSTSLTEPLHPCPIRSKPHSSQPRWCNPPSSASLAWAG